MTLSLSADSHASHVALATRTAAVLVRNWTVVAALERANRRAELPLTENRESGVLVCAHHRIVGSTEPATARGVRIGMKKRAAQALCPEAVVIDHDPEFSSVLFETVAAAVDTVAAGVDILRPGVVLMAARGPARHQGGEERLASLIMDAVADNTGWDCSVGIADGPFAALLAAQSGRIVAPGRSAHYLAPYSIDSLHDAPVGPEWGHRGHSESPHGTSQMDRRWDKNEVVGLLRRLGITTLGQFADLPAASVVERFGVAVGHLHTLAQGQEITPPASYHPSQPIEASASFDTPLVRADQAAFVARPLAEDLAQQLTYHGLICTRVKIVAHTEAGEELERTWRHEGAMTVSDIVDRVRWQCEGWITRRRMMSQIATSKDRDRNTASAITSPATAITRICLYPVQLMPATDAAPALWGGAGEASRRASRAFARIQALAGEESVVVPAERGGRLLGDHLAVVPWRSERPSPRSGPWPGTLPPPYPATVFHVPPAVSLYDATGNPVVVTARGILSAAPVRLDVPHDSWLTLSQHQLEPGRSYPVLSHSAPVIVDQRWWESGGQRGARIHLLLGTESQAGAGQGGLRLLAGPPDHDQLAVIAMTAGGVWSLEGLYD